MGSRDHNFMQDNFMHCIEARVKIFLHSPVGFMDYSREQE